MPRSLCGEDEWPKLNMCGGGRIFVQKNTQVSARRPVRFAARMARRTVLQNKKRLYGGAFCFEPVSKIMAWVIF